jgi:hypothetical protein
MIFTIQNMMIHFAEITWSNLQGFPLIMLLICFIIWVIGLVAVANGRFYDNTTKLCWFFIVLALNAFGVLLFAVWGMKQVDKGKKV